VTRIHRGRKSERAKHPRKCEHFVVVDRSSSEIPFEGGQAFLACLKFRLNGIKALKTRHLLN
jgi:hypothetical protein